MTAGLSNVCSVKGCGYRARTKAALEAHNRFIHMGGLSAPVPTQPEPAQVLPFKQKRVRERIAKAKVNAPVVEVPTGRVKDRIIEREVTPTEAAILEVIKPGSEIEYKPLWYDTREAWLLAAVERMRPDFEAVGRTVPPVRISIGWPGGRTARLDPLGQCWAGAAVADGIAAIFITPSQDDPIQVLATTRHEMVHAAGEMHHRAGFRKLAREVGFDPRPGSGGTSSTYRTPELQAKLEALNAALGPFPHAKVSKGLLDGRPKVQGTRMLKLVCPEDEYAVRTTAKWIAVGLPQCPDGHTMEVNL